jgi:hypothetical protein
MTNAPVSKPPKNYKKYYICVSLLFLESAVAITIFTLSSRLYIVWHHTTKRLQRTNDLLIHTMFFIATCAPLCAVLGVLVGALYYWRKRTKYGEYKVSMRRQGRGYWMDPADAEEARLWAEAKKINSEPRAVASLATTTAVAKHYSMSLSGSMMRGSTLSGSTLRGSTATTNTLDMGPERLAEPMQAKSKRVSFFNNPYGWVFKTEEPNEPQRPEPGLSRSDTVRTCDNDEITKKGVSDIWLGGLGKTGYTGRSVRKKNWDEEMEMDESRRNGWKL